MSEANRNFIQPYFFIKLKLSEGQTMEKHHDPFKNLKSLTLRTILHKKCTGYWAHNLIKIEKEWCFIENFNFFLIFCSGIQDGYSKDFER